VTGYPDSAKVVSEEPGSVEVRAEMIERLDKMGRELSTQLKDAPRTGAQSCYLPSTEDGLPVIGQLRSAPGVYVATGHGCWGILNAPATGKAVAELILDGKASCVQLGEAFSPDGRR
jgi:glycine/D-amino acid oxidase-like deaminating enzyme